MKLKKRFGFLPVTTLGLMLVFLFVIISHLFFVSGPAQATGGNSHTSFFRRKTESSLTVRRIDKTVLTENKPVVILRDKGSFITLLLNSPVFLFKPIANNRISVFLPDRHHIYLCNRIIRI